MNQVVFKNQTIAGAMNYSKDGMQKESVYKSPRKVTDMMVFDKHNFKPTKFDCDTISTCSSSICPSSPSSLRTLKQESSQITKSSRRPRVRFSDDPVTFAAEPPPPMTDDERAVVFWKPLEYILFKQYSKRIVQTLFKSDSTKRLQKAFQICVEAKKWDDEWLTTTVCTELSHTPARGLEVVACPELFAARSKTIKIVVIAQYQIPKDDNPDEVLRTVSEALSNPARRLARMLGHSDQDVTQHLHASR
jgi:hypothetical protein